MCPRFFADRGKHVVLERRQITIRQGKGRKDRVTMLPASAVTLLADHLDRVRRQHEIDRANGMGRVPLPHALDREYPDAGSEWPWQFVFPAARVW